MAASFRRLLNSWQRRLGAAFAFAVCLCLLAGCAQSAPLLATEQVSAPVASSSAAAQDGSLTIDSIPEYSGEASVVLAGGEPSFAEQDYAAAYGTEIYGVRDGLGRATGAFAVVGPETLPAEERKGQRFRPTGWNDDAYDGKKLYERCHLIAHCLTAEDDNPQNLLTGTRYLNHTGMLGYENSILEYVRGTGNHVLMRVVPVFEGDELLARGIHLEALSVEDAGKGIKLNVYLYNVQPGIVIDYATGKSHRASEQEAPPAADDAECSYVLNTNTRRFHLPTCKNAQSIKESNRQDVTAKRSDLIDQGYAPCGACHP